MDKETQEALRRIPDNVNKYVNEHSSEDDLVMGFALRKTTPRKRFTVEQRQFLDAKFKDGEKRKSKFDPRILAQDMRETFQPSDCLTWQQIASYFSVKGRKLRNEIIANENDDIVVDSDGQIIQVPDNQYMSDPNVGTVDEEIVKNTDIIMSLEDFHD